MQRADAILNHINAGDPNPYISGPGEALCKVIASELLKDPHWTSLFTYIDGYKREDYGFTNFPVLRIYTENDTKDYESWFINGEIILDSIFPADIRRVELQQVQDIVASAMLQQFRRTPFFNAVSQGVPGLNELGKKFVTNKALGYAWQDGDELAPLTQMTVNFRIDLRQWDLYLTDTNRTKDDPFDETLATLKKIALKIKGLKDDGTVGANVPQTGEDIIKV